MVEAADVVGSASIVEAGAAVDVVGAEDVVL